MSEGVLHLAGKPTDSALSLYTRGLANMVTSPFRAVGKIGSLPYKAAGRTLLAPLSLGEGVVKELSQFPGGDKLKEAIPFTDQPKDPAAEAAELTDGTMFKKTRSIAGLFTFFKYKGLHR